MKRFIALSGNITDKESKIVHLSKKKYIIFEAESESERNYVGKVNILYVNELE